jgi:glucose/arabinose dehydrogenase
MRRGLALLPVAVLALGGLNACGDSPEGSDIPHITQPTDLPDQPTPPESPSDSANRPPKVAEVVADGLAVPWGLDFLPDGDAIVTERDSRRILRIAPHGEATALGTIEAADPRGEAGLLGVAVPPDFAEDPRVFVYVTTTNDNRILRVPLTGDTLGTPESVLDGIPQGFTHDGGRLAFGPDGYLYASTGEVGDPELSQDPDSLGGKILRITEDGQPAPGNPDPGSPIWTTGHRNVQGLAWDDRDQMWASELGDASWDELNRIKKGKNYGWPRVEGKGGAQDFADPVLVWPVADASPSGLAWADGNLWMAGLRGQRLWRIDTEDLTADAFFRGEYGRLRTVATAPDGSLWVTTSNRDGRGDPVEADDRILRITP